MELLGIAGASALSKHLQEALLPPLAPASARGCLSLPGIASGETNITRGMTENGTIKIPLEPSPGPSPAEPIWTKMNWAFPQSRCISRRLTSSVSIDFSRTSRMRWMEVKNNSSANWKLDRQRPTRDALRTSNILEHPPWVICCLFSRLPGKSCSQMAVGVAPQCWDADLWLQKKCC